MKLISLLLLIVIVSIAGTANNISVTNATTTGQNTSAGVNHANNYTMVQFDLSWQNSWRITTGPKNWDAAWVFVKFMVGVSNPVLTGASSSGTTVTVSSTANLRAGMPVEVSSGTGDFATNTVISSISSATTFVVSATPTVALSNATITCQRIWEHAKLNNNVNNYTPPAGSIFKVPSDGLGVFIHRSSSGTGTFSLNDVQLRWDYGSNGVTDDAPVSVRVFAIEMVWVPTGEFAMGGGTSYGFTLTTINTQDASIVPSGTGNLGGEAGGHPTGVTAPNASWPNGYKGFYCMKYQITQGDYRDFLNTLTRAQQNTRTETNLASGITSVNERYVMSGTASRNNRNAIRCDSIIHTSNPIAFYCDFNGNGIGWENDDGGWIASNFISWSDGCAYVDWAGLRPMTEMEYEKACRGNQPALNNEMAWGGTGNSATNATGISNPGSTNEAPSNAGANCNVYGGLNGPIRVGAFAGVATSRIESGASYYGIMELSGNLWERTVNLGNADGRIFTGINGDGQLSKNGHANQSNWPGMIGTEVIEADGSAYRGGSWMFETFYMRVSDRSTAGWIVSNRFVDDGFRGVRVFP